MGAFDDPLGFTRQTATLLRGLGAGNLIPEFEKRNISTSALHQLTKEDFVRLGASEEDAEHMVNTLNITNKKKQQKDLTLHSRTKLLEIIQHSRQHLFLLQKFVAYCRLRLTKEKINFFVDPDKALSASQVLCITAETTLQEFKYLEQAVSELEEVIKPPKVKRNLFTIRLCTIVGGIGLVTCIGIRLYRRYLL